MGWPACSTRPLSTPPPRAARQPLPGSLRPATGTFSGPLRPVDPSMAWWVQISRGGCLRRRMPMPRSTLCCWAPTSSR